MSYDSTVRSIVIERRKRWKHSMSMSNARTVWTTALSTGSSDLPGVEVGEEPVTEVGQRGCAHLGRHIATTLGRDLVDDVVGVAGERVQGVHVVLLDLRQHLRRPVVRGAVALVELAAQLVALVERDRTGRQQLRGRRRRCRRRLSETPVIGGAPVRTARRVRRRACPTPAPSARRRRAGSTSR